MAVIIVLPTAALHPVQQHRTRGRHPKMVVNLRRYQIDKAVRASLAREGRRPGLARTKSSTLKEALLFYSTAKEIFQTAQHRLAAAERQAQGDQS